MKFHHYLEELFRSGVSISLVRALVKHKGKVFTIRELARTANVSSAEAAVVVERLEKLGIISIQPVGRSHQVLLNERSYILNKIMRQIIKAEDQTLDELQSILKKHLNVNGIIASYLFGSISKGEEKEDSDIDLLVISNNFDYASASIARAQDEILSTFGNRISPVILSEKELKVKKNDRLVRSIMECYAIIKGRDLKELVEEKQRRRSVNT